MEDVQDGIKVSIQDGVTEDPIQEEKLILIGKSFMALISISYELPCPKIESEIQTSTDSEDIYCTIGTVLETVVT